MSAFPLANVRPTKVLLATVFMGSAAAWFQIAFINNTASMFAGLSNPAFLQGDHWPELRQIFVNTGYAVSYALSLTTSQWLGSICALYWQRSLVDQFHRVYFKSKVLYAASKMVPELDNVDQRIADDSRNFTQGLSTFMFGGNNLGVTEGQGVLQAALVAIVLFVFCLRTSWFPAVWVVAIGVVSCVVLPRLSRPVPPATFAWRIKEGDLRFAHSRQREYCEAVAFYRGQQEER